MGELANPRTSRVVLIGTAGYEHLAQLPAVVGNVGRLRQICTDSDLWGVPPERIEVLLNPPDTPTVARIVRAAASDVGPDGLLLVYFAGHGLIDPNDGQLVLALPGTEPAVPYEAGLLYEHLRRAVKASPAGRRLVILDCCYAGRAGGALAGEDCGTQAVADLALIDQTCLLVSAAANRRAQAPEGAQFTAFTGELVRILSEGLPGRPAVLDVKTVWQEVERALRSKGFERPELRAGNGGETIGLVRNAARHPRDLPGSILVAAPRVTDRDLAQAVVLVLRHDPVRGAVGVRLNTPLDQPADRLPENWLPLLTEPATIFAGGPITNDERDGYIALALLRPNVDAPVRFVPVRDRLGTIPLMVDPQRLRTVLTGVRLFSGYLGWGPDRLESYLDDGTLLRTEHPPHQVLFRRPDRAWSTLQAQT